MTKKRIVDLSVRKFPFDEKDSKVKGKPFSLMSRRFNMRYIKSSKSLLRGMLVGRFENLSIEAIKRLSKLFRVNLGSYTPKVFFGVVDDITRTNSVQINTAREENILLLTEEEYLYLLLRK